ncbi:MAG: O-antigen ligase family protein [Polyangiaceae bacterium]
MALDQEAPLAPRVKRGLDSGPMGTRERWLLALVIVALAGSALAIGAVHTVVLVPVALVAMAAAIVAVPLWLAPKPDRTFTAPGILLIALGLYSAAQAIPLPLGLLEKIAPANADVWARSLAPLGEVVTRGSISLDPGASLVEALKWITYGCVFLAAATLSMRRGPAFVLGLVFSSATLVAATTLLHGITGATKVFGIYEPSWSFAPNHMGPLLNPNNLAGYVTLGAICGLGLILGRRPLVPRWLVAVGVALDIGAIVRSASRGGVAALVIGVLVLAGLAWKAASRRTSLKHRVLPFALLGSTVVFGGALALLGGTGAIWRDLLQDNVAKLKLVDWTVPLLREFRWFGVGRGAFESVFEAYRPAIKGHIVYTHPENFPAQWAAEWGVVVAFFALATTAWLFRPTAMSVTRSSVAAAGWCAVLALAIQNLADLGLEIPAVAIAATVVMGALWGNPHRRRRRRDQPWHRAFARIGLPRFASGVAAAGAVIALLALAFGYRDVGGEREILREAFDRADDEAAQRPAFRASLRAAMTRRPAEHYFPLLGAMAAFRWDHEPKSALKWLERALERAPRSGRAHALLATVLADMPGGRRQALLELRLATEYDAAMTEASMPLATALGKTFDDLMIAVPEGPDGGIVLQMMARWLRKPEQQAIRHKVDVEALARDPSLIEPRQRLLLELFAAMADIQAGKEPKTECKTLDACNAEVERHAKAIDVGRPDSSLGATTRARALIVSGKREQAEILLRDGCARPEGRTECLEVRIDNLSELKDADMLDAVLKEYMSDGCTSSLPCASAATFVAAIRARRGDNAAAALAYIRAAQEDPTEERWTRAADAAEKAKMTVQAIDALQRVASFRGGNDAAINARISKLRATAQSDLLLQR